MKQSIKRKVCSNFQMSFLHLSHTDTPVDEVLGQVHIFCQIFGSGWPLVIFTPLIKASSCQEWYNIRSAWHLVILWVRLTFGQMYPPVEVSSGQEWYYIRSAWHFISLLASLAFGQTYPLVEASNGQEWYYVGSS